MRGRDMLADLDMLGEGIELGGEAWKFFFLFAKADEEQHAVAWVFTQLQRSRRSLFRVLRRQGPEAFYRLVAWSVLERDGADAYRNVCPESQRTQAPAGLQPVFRAVLGVPWFDASFGLQGCCCDHIRWFAHVPLVTTNIGPKPPCSAGSSERLGDVVVRRATRLTPPLPYQRIAPQD